MTLEGVSPAGIATTGLVASSYSVSTATPPARRAFIAFFDPVERLALEAACSWSPDV
jgi:hypothetical protein